MTMFMAFHAPAERKPILVAASISIIAIGIGVALMLA
jgi:hypothetical protein